ncbi:flagellar biosynthetic protein FliO [Hoeflea sp. TYP-13]|uniref:flagellar biosynthetic protein FliO n=1 Tax=Hoeflea sp. TYP-13 TaxID=3230023 RepID=UPI0034C66DD4
MSDALTGTGGMSIYSLLIIGAVVVVLFGLFLWHLRRRGHMAFIRGGSNRQPRLAVLDAAAVDARRRLVLVRRDNVEHLIMIGGPSDIVVERGINRASVAARAGHQEAAAQQAHAQPAAPKDQQRPQQPQGQPRPEPKQPPKPQPQPIATEPLNIPVTKPAKKPEEPVKADTPPLPGSEPVPPIPPLASEAKPPPLVGSTRATPVAPDTRSPPPQNKSQQAPAPELAAVAVSAAAASAANEMAKLDAKGPAAEPAGPVVDVMGPAAGGGTIGDEENAITAELEDVLDAARELVMPDTRTEPASADEIIAAPQVDVAPPAVEIPEVETAQPVEGEEAPQPSAITADELIADFDELLEAEISKAEQQKAANDPGTETSPEATDKPEPETPSASLEDEMKKLLGDLSVKQ